MAVCVLTASAVVQLGAPPAKPVAAFIYSPSSPVTGSPVSFDASASSCYVAPCLYRWTDNADGSVLGNGVKMSFTFQQAGTKYVRLTLTDARSRTASVQKNVVVTQAVSAPVASFTYSPSNPLAGSAVSFDGSASKCDATPCTYRWTDDADASLLGTGVTMSFVFQQAGAKYVRLTVTDSQGRNGSMQQNVTVVTTSDPPVSGAYYVSTSGNDSNPGTSAFPWRTIQKAASTLTAGQTVIVSAGTYNERINAARSGGPAGLITFQANGTVIVQGFIIQSSYVKVTGFEIANAPGTGWSDRMNGAGIFLSGSYNTVSGNYIHHTPAAGIYFASAAGNNNISGNRIEYGVECGIYINGANNLIEANDISHTRSIGGSDADGVRFFGSGNIVRKNKVHDIILSDSPGQSPHIDAFQTWGPASNYVFEQNFIDKQPAQQQGFTIEGIYQPVGDITIRNNVFVTRGTGYQPNVNVGDMGPVTNVTIANNTMVAMNGAAEYAIWVFRNLNGAVIKNNAIYDHGNSSSPYIRVDSGATNLDIGFNSISKSNGLAPAGFAYPGDLWMVSPLFAGMSALDFHLQPASPLLNRGINLPQVTSDYDGVSRPQQLMTDIGAFEYKP
jgi:parallel beta-helix repeat protein